MALAGSHLLVQLAPLKTAHDAVAASTYDQHKSDNDSG